MVLINASNLHVGGAVQVASSFIYEASYMPRDFSHVHVVVSNEVDIALTRTNTRKEIFGHYEVLDTHGLDALTSSLNEKIFKYSTVFTIFGPNYLRVKSPREIVGFAQPWIINPNNPIFTNMGLSKKLLTRFKFAIQWLFFLRADHYIVELQHVKSDLAAKKNIALSKISVVHNSASSIYLNRSQWRPIQIDKKLGFIGLGFATRDYPHKNTNILPYVADILRSEYGLSVHFYLTLRAAEYANKDNFFKEHVSAVGEIFPDQCPSFYSQMDGVIFPSLLECFSATPLEAMMMRKPLFASDRDFVRDICGDNVIYFNPLDPAEIAAKIAQYFNGTLESPLDLDKAVLHAQLFSSATARAQQYLEIISEPPR